ncbi:carboxymuconolactone decarboxylase family protein [Amycolatopsis rhizosphaerae]|uniref:Carboxymuconolactone decarboxylase family protein n=1 Tax=Amycolatopsis rhizosphaerae TaxID=2053003 RepID=A0A558DB14_9PSEU|nr:carboxymuconolactone decarboxylase family protein [Amycolatopsis rhizosphaerae]TVT58166.1 carboxymuconolactone decarboxylase family protein [Amycolatopsis rhizosphaerae]
MPRIPAVSAREAGLQAKLLYRVARRRFGAVPEPFAVLANHPALLRTSAIHELLAEKAVRALPKHVADLAVYRTAVRLGCSWCIDFGTMLQKHQGLDIDRLKNIDDYATSPLFDRAERLALAYADAMSDTPVSVTSEQVAELEREFGRRGLLELTYQIGLENQRARMFGALDITDQGFTSGEACRVPGLG